MNINQSPNHRLSETDQASLAWFAANIPPEYLTHPEYFLYSTALDVQQMQDVPESRRRFKQVLVERQVGEGMELPQIDQRQIHDFMNPNDTELKLQRSEELLELTSIHLEAQQDFAQAQRLAVLELFHKEAPFRQVKMDESYFRNRELVEADLRGFLEHAKGDLITDLCANNPKYSVIKLSQSGELVTWNTYLKRASRVLLGTKKRGGDSHRRPDALNTLFRIVGVNIPEYIPTDEAYFNNPECVKADLTAYLQFAKGDSISDLNTSNPKNFTRVKCQSGELVTWQAYLNRASGVLLGTKGKDNPHRLSNALKALLRIAGVDIPEYVPMDEKYFNNPEFVRADLIAYLQYAKGDLIECLKAGSNPKASIIVRTNNREHVRWGTYLKRASRVLLGTSQRTKDCNPHRCAEVLKVLQESAGVDIPELIPMDEEYFNNLEYVKADFVAYLQHVDGDLINCLNSSNPDYSTSVVTQNGENVRWATYLNRASAALLGTRDNGRRDNCPRPSDALRALFRVIGEIVVETMDEEYFNNPEYVNADLNNYLKYASGDVYDDLSTNNPKSGTYIHAKNNENVRWATYLNRASYVFFKTNRRSNNPHRPVKALKKLIEIARQAEACNDQSPNPND